MKKPILLFALLGILLTIPAFAGNAQEPFPTISWEQAIDLSKDKKSPAIFVDVRTPEEVASGTVAGSINIPLQQIQVRYKELPKDKKILIFCRSGKRSRAAAEYLTSMGYSNAYNVDGGFLKAPPAAAFK